MHLKKMILEWAWFYLKEHFPKVHLKKCRLGVGMVLLERTFSLGALEEMLPGLGRTVSSLICEKDMKKVHEESFLSHL